MLSRVLIALQAKSPGRPSSRYHKSGATTASAKFSAADSIAARATAGASRLAGSRPTMWATAARASSMPRRSPRATARTWSCRPRYATRVLATSASRAAPAGTAEASAWISAPAPAAAKLTPSTTAPPRSVRRASDTAASLRRASRLAIARPASATGCGTFRYRAGGSPIAASAARAARARRKGSKSGMGAGRRAGRRQGGWYPLAGSRAQRSGGGGGGRCERSG